ncbi:NUDIX domain-containing protein [Sporosarcina sp. Sa2YVA2]|uniref:NUDIX domain-containing protein n=1 Tax=Sporosarcina quadrami TaxID=2762234 RepID=A0ABR8UEC8_9BACL|nr:NUDIX domain-containing protein [Sporosarcina quadrami]MBD7986371.1 NUDIX domain-containing protein [Sporosarcina quadrami]
MTERLKVFDEDYRYIGEETRDMVHEKGLWHETFHCWLVDETNVYIQKRSYAKKDFPGLYDITAAGHLLASEKVMDGIREVEEELGITVDSAKLLKAGVVRDVIRLPGFIDKEFTNVFLYQSTFSPTDFSLQKEEVEGIYTVLINDLKALFQNERYRVLCTNLMDGVQGEATLNDFVPHETDYFNKVAEMLEREK